jgi:hypothetical protein
MSAGRVITHDHELPTGWHDVIAQRAAGKLRLFVDGKLAGETDDGRLNLATGRLGTPDRQRPPGTVRRQVEASVVPRRAVTYRPSSGRGIACATNQALARPAPTT